MGSLYNRKSVPLLGFFALALETLDNSDQEWGDMKATLNAFKSHSKNQIGVGWTGTVQGGKKGGKNGVWNAQHHLHSTKDNIVTYGGRVYLIRATKAHIDGFFIKIAQPAPHNYNPTKPFQIANGS